MVHLKRNRQWKLFCTMQTASVGDKTWRISGNEKDDLEEIVFRKRFLLNFAMTAEMGSIERGSATILLREVLQPDEGDQLGGAGWDMIRHKQANENETL